MSQNSNYKQRIIKELHKFFGFENQSDAAKFYGVSRQKYTGWYHYGTAWPDEIVIPRVTEVAEGISEVWLKTGKGDMLKDKSKSQNKTGNTSNNDSARKKKDREEKGQRFKIILDYLSHTKQVDAARFFNISPQLLSSWKDGGWPFEKVYRKVKGIISPDWLFSGEGEMLVDDQGAVIKDYKKQIQELNNENGSLKKENEKLKNLITNYKAVLLDINNTGNSEAK